MPITVSVIIPFYNDPYITQAVESALSQSYPYVEIIVVDDGSNARHQKLLEPYLSNIRYIRKEQGGTGSALNEGIRAATGEYIAWLSSDDLFYRRKIEFQLEAMQRAGAMISHTAFNYIDRLGRVTDYAVYPPDSLSSLYHTFIKGNPVNGCTVMMSKALIAKVGMFNESLAFTQDLDYWYRVLLLGVPMLLIKQPLTAYRKHPAMSTLLYQGAVMQEAQATYNRYEEPLRRLIARNGL
jgi:teichuronic acid biosynthesis glycosyltransferase TuaG